jgi:hypothetical protein
MNKHVASLALGVALFAAQPALAQEKSAGATQIPSGVFFKGQQANQWLARDNLVGAKVENEKGQIIGDIEDIILNDSNQVEGVIMGTGGFLGAAEKKVGVRFSALKIVEKDGKRHVTLPAATKEVLKALEPYKRANPPKSLWDRAMDKAKELSDKTAETSRDAYQSAKEQAGPALEKAKEQAGQAYEKARDKAREMTGGSSTPEAPKQ